MSRKTPVRVLKMLERYEEKMLHFEEILRVKSTVPVENQANHIREKSFDYYQGMIDGVVSSMQDILHENKCYSGFYYVDSKREPLEFVSGQRIQENPEYRYWRIAFYTKE